MYLKYLELYGFKSFPDKVRLSFGKGLTAVVGPNGSGKSNISDAVRWVLGEQSTKTLRGDKMQDVIFGGTQKRNPLGFAQVVLTIGNEERELPVDTDEISISRKLYRDGESEYRINENLVRLRDIYELFMDTGLGRDGYSIIGQGKIAEIITAKPAGRREIFEEAAGISKYRYRKNEAQKKLVQTEENLVRLRDIVTELEDRVGPLKIQAEKAKKYAVLAEENKKLEISLWTAKLAETTVRLRQLSDEYAISQLDEKKADESLQALEQALEAIHQKILKTDIDTEATRARMKTLEEEIAEAGAKAAVLQNDIYHNEQAIAKLEKDWEFAQASQEQFGAMIEEKQKEKEELEAKEAALLAEIAGAEGAAKELAGQIAHIEDEIAKAAACENALSFEVSEKRVFGISHQNALDDINERLAALAQSEEEKHQRQQTLQKEQADITELVQTLKEAVSSSQNAIKGLQMKLDARLEKERAATAQKEKLEVNIRENLHKISLLTELERNMEGFAHSVKYILAQGKSGALKGVHGALSNIIQVENRYLTAIETAAGAALQNIVVEDENTAKRAIALLKSAGNGRATFLPLTAVKGRRLNEKGLEKSPGFIGIGADLVRFDPKYQGIVDSVLGRTAVVDDLDNAVQMAKAHSYQFRIVTLDGQVVNTGGSMTGGSAAKSTGLLSRRGEIERLEEENSKRKQTAAELDGQIQTLARETAAVKAQLIGAEGEGKTAAEDLIRYEAEEKRLAVQLADLETDRERAAEQQEKMAAQAAMYEKNIKETHAQMQTAQDKLEKAQANTTRLREDLEKLIKQREDSTEQTSRWQMDKMSLAQQIALVRQAIADQLSRKDDQQKQAAQYQEQKAAYEASSAEILAGIEQTQSEAEEKKENIKKLQEQIAQSAQIKQQQEKESTELRQTEKELIIQKEKYAGAALRVQDQMQTVQRDYDGIISKIWDEYEMTRREAESFIAPAEDIPKTTRALSEVKGKIRALGSVNLEAIDEYEQVSSRYTFLSEQMQDVERSKTKLQQLIQSLTGEMREIFSKSFEKINHHFSRIFTELFEGGRAELTLTPGEDVLDAGIEIYVQPPGKIIKNLTLLSGGEQAFVAIAMYFAILKVRPAPFCLLDEIEAALDDVNVNKFAQYLRRLNQDTQFIAITHRRGTMEHADVLYGVTMEEEGVSKLLELDVSEIESKLGMKQQV